MCGRLWRGVDFPCAVMVANKQTGPILDAIYINTYLHGQSNGLLAMSEVHLASIQNFSRDFLKCVGDLVKFSAYEMSKIAVVFKLRSHVLSGFHSAMRC